MQGERTMKFKFLKLKLTQGISFAKCFNLLKLKYCTEYEFSRNSATCFTRHGSCTLQHFV